MRLKSILMTGTALALTAALSVSAPLAQSGGDTAAKLEQAGLPVGLLDARKAVAAAEAALTTAENEGGDVESAQAALADAEANFAAMCQSAGFGDVQSCSAAIDAALAAELAPPPAVEEVAPVEEPVMEEEPAQQDAAPAEEPAAEEPAPEQQPAAEEPAPEEQQASEEPAMEEEPAQQEQAADEPATEEPVAEEPATEESVQEEPVQEEPAMEEMAPAIDIPETALNLTDDAAARLEAAGLPAGLIDAFAAVSRSGDDYEMARASGGDVAGAEQRLRDAIDNLSGMCTDAGFADIETCRAGVQAAIDTEPQPEEMTAEEQGGEAAEEPVASEEQAAAEEAEEPEPVSEEALEQSDVEPLPKSVPEEEAAPVLDSAKEAETEAETGAGDDQQATAEDQQAEEQPVDDTPPPASDEEAQADAVPEEVESATAEEGETVAVEEARRERRDRRPDNAEVVEQEGNRIIFQINNQIVIRGGDENRFYDEDEDDVFYERLRGGNLRETVTRPNGVQIVTIYNRNGDVIRRSRIMPDGREIVLVYLPEDREEDLLDWSDPGRDLPRLQLDIPVGEYIFSVSANSRSNDLVDFWERPPVERVERLYSVDEVKRSARIRDKVRRVEIDTLTFGLDSARLSQDQIAKLASVANAMHDMLDRYPGHTFLIEGHTDATGSDLYNLALSDRRAAAVAIALTEYFDIPPENLATQGYGERYLKVQTQEANRYNRRVTIRRITPLISPIASN